MHNKIIQIIHDRFEQANGYKLPNDNAINKRIYDAAKKSIAELYQDGTASINIPFIIADKSGPKHLMVSITREEVESFNLISDQPRQRRSVNTASKRNKSSSFLNNVHKSSSNESDPGNYMKSVMQKNEKEKRSEKKSNAIFFIIFILILGMLFFSAFHFFNIF